MEYNKKSMSNIVYADINYDVRVITKQILHWNDLLYLMSRVNLSQNILENDNESDTEVK